MMLKLNMTICYLNFSLPKFELKSKLKSFERKLKNIISQKCVKGLVDEEEKICNWIYIFFLQNLIYRDGLVWSQPLCWY